MSNRIQELYRQGQSVWCDNLSRAMIDSGELRRLIDLGVVGITSNPTIFMKSITGSLDYDDRLSTIADDACDILEVYEGLVLPDIIDAADLLRPVFDRTSGVDGSVSLEVNPKLAYDTEATVAEARRLFGTIDRPNVFIKVPATDEGIPAIETLIADGININVTLIFSLSTHENVMRAYINGLNKRSVRGQDVSGVASVASFFVSRVDTLVDRLLEKKRAEGAKVDHLFGKAAIANARLAYRRFESVFDPNGEFARLAAQGARVQRPLWASTSSKNPSFRDTIYVDELVGPQTVNTMPPQTIEAVLDHGSSKTTIRDDLPAAVSLFESLADFGIDIEQITDQLRVEGVDAFAQSFDELLANLERKQTQLRAGG